MNDKYIRAFADHGMTVLDALADSWAEDVNLTAMIKDATSLLDDPSNDAQHTLRNRIEARIYAIVRQAFQEGALGAITNFGNEQDKLRALSLSPLPGRDRK